MLKLLCTYKIYVELDFFKHIFVYDLDILEQNLSFIVVVKLLSYCKIDEVMPLLNHLG